MLRCQIFDDNTWLYPDTALTSPDNKLPLIAARGGTAAFQILTDVTLYTDAAVGVTLTAPAGVTLQAYQLLPAHVEENSAPTTHTTLDYDLVRDYVTRQAPFDVYDVTRPLDGRLKPGRIGLYLLLTVAPDAVPGTYDITLQGSCMGETVTVTLPLTVSACVIPALPDAEFGMVNWLSLDDIAASHKVKKGADAFWKIVGRYLDHQLGMRTNHLKLSSGVPIRDPDGKVVDFDFTECEKLGELALSKGFSYIYGGFVARFKDWRDADQYLLWDRDISTSSREGYRQLSIYFRKLWSIVRARGWEDRWMQCLVDEPQFPNSESYRALSCICRKWMPGVKIHDPVETSEIGGATDIWCVKQAVYEKHLDAFRELQAMGEEMWVYTCGFPAGKCMNRATDLPLLAGRLPMWLCAKYGFTGFLHWGYNAYGGNDPFRYNCYHRSVNMLPPGNGFIVYPGDDRPWDSMRSHLQRAGAEEYEALLQLPEDKRQQLIAKVARTFDDYESDPAAFAKVRRELLETF